MDIFGDDIDSFLEAGELNENIREADIDENDENENGAENDEDSKGEPKTVEPKKRSARRPQVCMQKLQETTNYAPKSLTGELCHDLTVDFGTASLMFRSFSSHPQMCRSSD